MGKRMLLLLLFSFLLCIHISLADKPYSDWERSDIMEYFEENDIIFEGEYKNNIQHQYIIIGRLNSNAETVILNFFLSRGKLEKALLTTPENTTFHALQNLIEELGFEKVSESNDQLGNKYRRYLSGQVELTVVNKKADWPEVYFRP